jgi:hypothetical protein
MLVHRDRAAAEARLKLRGVLVGAFDVTTESGSDPRAVCSRLVQMAAPIPPMPPVPAPLDRRVFPHRAGCKLDANVVFNHGAHPFARVVR